MRRGLGESGAHASIAAERDVGSRSSAFLGVKRVYLVNGASADLHQYVSDPGQRWVTVIATRS